MPDIPPLVCALLSSLSLLATQALSELVDLVAAELSRKMRDVAASTARISDLEARLAGRSEELAQLQGTLK